MTVKHLAGLLLFCLLLTSGCAATSRKPPAAPAPAPPEAATAPPSPSPTHDDPLTLPVLQPDDIMGAKVAANDGAFLSVYRHPGLFRALTEALRQAGASDQPSAASTSRFTVDLYLSPSEVWRLSPAEGDVVAVTVGGKSGTLHSPELVRALEAMGQLIIPLDRTALQRVQVDLGAGWSEKEHDGIHTEWENAAAGLSLTALPWQGVQLDESGKWPVADRYREGSTDTVAVDLKGRGQTYPAIRLRPIIGGTGGGFWGTWPLQVDVVGRSGGLSLICNSTVSSQDPAQRQVAQAAVDQRCPALLQRFTVDLGEPIPPAFALETIPAGKAAMLQREGEGWRLLMAPETFENWEGQRGPRLWQFAAGKREWLLDLERGDVRPAPLPWPENFRADARGYRLPDGRFVGLLGNQSSGATQVTFVLQDAAGATQVELGQVAGDVMAIAPAGDTALAYTLRPPGSGYAPGALWQLDWASGERHRIAEQGWPVGRLADGRAIAHRGGKTGQLVAWRATAPADLQTLTPDDVKPFGALISPDGNRLVYFYAENESAPDYPRVTALAIYDATSGQTDVKQLPGPGYVYYLNWEASGNLVFSAGQSAAVYELRPDGELVTLTPPGENGSLYGRDGCALLLGRNDGIYRYRPPGCDDASIPPGPTLLANSRGSISGVDLLGLPRGSGMEILSLRTGRRYWASGLALPYLPALNWLQLGPLRPESGYVSLQVQTYPQASYRIVPVTPIPR